MRWLFFTLLLAVEPALAITRAELVNAAIDRIQHNITYDGRYIAIPYPNGDVPEHIGVCTDVVIRSYRNQGIDLQQLVHEDMAANFALYPSKRTWGLSTPDTNIDHRRVLNVAVFLRRHGESLPISANKDNYQAGDIVTWMIGGKLPHIGIVTDRISPITGNPLIVHNIGAGPALEDWLFQAPITGHFSYLPTSNR